MSVVGNIRTVREMELDSPLGREVVDIGDIGGMDDGQVDTASVVFRLGQGAGTGEEYYGDEQ